MLSRALYWYVSTPWKEVFMTANMENNGDDQKKLIDKIAAYEMLDSEIQWADDDLLKSVRENLKKQQDPRNPPVQWALLDGLLKAFDLELKIRSHWETGRGKWYAVASKLKWEDSSKLEGAVDEIEAIECDSKPNAVEAARKMAIKHSELIDGLTTVEVEIKPKIAYCWVRRKTQI